MDRYEKKLVSNITTKVKWYHASHDTRKPFGCRLSSQSWSRGPAVRAAGARAFGLFLAPVPWRQRRGRRVLGTNSGPHFCDHRDSAMPGSHSGIVAYWNAHRFRHDGFSATRVQKVVISRAKRRVHGTLAGCRLGPFLETRIFLFTNF